MNCLPRVLLVGLLISVAPQFAVAQENSRVAQLLASAQKALEAKETATALRLATEALQVAPKNPEVLVFRAQVLAVGRDFKAAVADLDEAVSLAPKWAAAYDARGDIRFKAGEFEAAVADFDKFLEFRPQLAPGHWRRGISLYYAGKFAEGRDQFAAYQKVDGADVENAVWHYLCNMHVVDKEQARREIPPTQLDRRVPLMKVYALFKGEGTVEEVIKAAQEPGVNEEENRSRNFYANLYLGLYYVSENQLDKALEHLKAASIPAHEPSGYMWEVARVHADLLAKEPEAEKK